MLRVTEPRDVTHSILQHGVCVPKIPLSLPYQQGKIGIVGGAVQVDPLGTAATNMPTVPASGDYDDGETGGMIGRGNRSTRRKPAPVPLCPPQIPRAVRTRTRAASVGSQRLTA
jgi:hypothetical protein